jgi:hypothetical protein
MIYTPTNGNEDIFVLYQTMWSILHRALVEQDLQANVLKNPKKTGGSYHPRGLGWQVLR